MTSKQAKKIAVKTGMTVSQVKQSNIQQKQSLTNVIIRGLDKVFDKLMSDTKKAKKLYNSSLFNLLRNSYLTKGEDNQKTKGDLLEVLLYFLNEKYNFFSTYFKGYKVIEVEHSSLTQDYFEKWDFRMILQDLNTGQKRYHWVNAKNSEIIGHENTKGFNDVPNTLRQLDGSPVDPRRDMTIIYCGTEDNWRIPQHWKKGHKHTWMPTYENTGVVADFINWLKQRHQDIQDHKQALLESYKQEYLGRQRRKPQQEWIDFLNSPQESLTPIRNVIAGQGSGKTFKQTDEAIWLFNNNPEASIDYVNITIDLLDQTSFEILKYVVPMYSDVKINMVCSDLEYSITRTLGIDVNRISVNDYLNDPTKIYFNGEVTNAKENIIDAVKGKSITFITQAQFKQWSQFRADNDLRFNLLQIDETVEKLDKTDNRYADNDDTKNFQQALDIQIGKNLHDRRTCYDANKYLGPDKDGFHMGNEHYFGPTVIDWPFNKCADEGLCMIPQPNFLVVPPITGKLKKWAKDKNIDDDDLMSIHAIIHAIEEKLDTQDHIWDLGFLKRADSCRQSKGLIEDYFRDMGYEFIVQSITSRDKYDRKEYRAQRNDSSNRHILVLGVYVPSKGFDWPNCEEIYIGRGFTEEKFTHVITRITRLSAEKLYSKLTIIRHDDKETRARLQMHLAESYIYMGLDLGQLLVDNDRSKGGRGEQGVSDVNELEKLCDEFKSNVERVEHKFKKKQYKEFLQTTDIQEAIDYAFD